MHCVCVAVITILFSSEEVKEHSPPPNISLGGDGTKVIGKSGKSLELSAAAQLQRSQSWEAAGLLLLGKLLADEN